MQPKRRTPSVCTPAARWSQAPNTLPPAGCDSGKGGVWRAGTRGLLAAACTRFCNPEMSVGVLPCLPSISTLPLCPPASWGAAPGGSAPCTARHARPSRLQPYSAPTPGPLRQIHVSPWGAAPVSKTQPQYGVCKDNDPKCPQWAAAGECDANPVYMRGTDAARGNCRRVVLGRAALVTELSGAGRGALHAPGSASPSRGRRPVSCASCLVDRLCPCPCRACSQAVVQGVPGVHARRHLVRTGERAAGAAAGDGDGDGVTPRGCAPNRSPSARFFTLRVCICDRPSHLKSVQNTCLCVPPKGMGCTTAGAGRRAGSTGGPTRPMRRVLAAAPTLSRLSHRCCACKAEADVFMNPALSRLF